MATNCAPAMSDWQQSFESYVHLTSWRHMVCVCAFTMVPPFGSFIVLELLPVAAPSAGWTANWVFWVRTYLNMISLAAGGISQVQAMAPSAPFTFRNGLVVALAASTGVVLALLLLASIWGFPIPYTDFIGYVLWKFFFWVSILAALGLRDTVQDPAMRKRFIFCEQMILAQGSLVVIYSVYRTAFASLTDRKQALFAFLLPVIKFSMKRIMSRIPGHNDMSIMLVKATVDTFEALFIFKCMQAATSWISVLTLAMVDLGLSMIHVRSFYQFNRHDMRVASLKNAIDSLSLRTMFWRRKRIAPSVRAISNVRGSVVPRVIEVATTGSRTLDQEAQLQFFLYCREILLIKFVECAVTIFYLIYFVVLVHLPNARYYPEMACLTIGKVHHTVASIATYALLQSVSLLVMHWFLKQHFNLSALHVLAFTLEKQGLVLHGTFMIWVHVVLNLTLVHNGTSATLYGLSWV